MECIENSQVLRAIDAQPHIDAAKDPAPVSANKILERLNRVGFNAANCGHRVSVVAVELIDEVAS